VLDGGSIVMGGIEKQTVEQAVELAVSMYENNEQRGAVRDYEEVNVSAKVVKIIQSYTDIINRTVWRK